MLINTIKNHLVLYPSPGNLNYTFNLGFTISILMVIQILSGLLLTLFYLNNFNGYYAITNLLLDINYGFVLRYVHNNNTSLLMIFIFMHIYRQVIYRVTSNIYVFNSGMIILYMLMAELFLGYLLVYGQISYWGATVIINLLSFIPDFIEWLSGDYMITLITIKRFFIIHFVLGLAIILVMVLHFFQLHRIGSNGIMSCLVKMIPLYIFVIKDAFGIVVLYPGVISQYFMMWLKFAHNDNMLEVNTLVTPSHIIPEWYFLPLYLALKCIPDKFSGLLFLTLLLLPWHLISVDSGISNSSIRISRTRNICLLFLIIMSGGLGAELPQVVYVYYGRLILLYIIISISLSVPLGSRNIH